MTIRLADYGGGPPALTADELKMDAGEVAVLTIAKVEPNVEVPQAGEAPRRVLVLRFKERPDNAFYCNKTSLKRLVKGFGEDEAKWVGKQLPLIASDQINPNSGEATVSLWVTDPKTWAKHLKGSRAAKARK